MIRPHVADSPHDPIRYSVIVAGALLLFAVGGCGPQSVTLNSGTRSPMILQESAYTESGCREHLTDKAHELGMTLQSVSVKGWFFGDTLLWPLYKGYVCFGTDRDLPALIVGSPTTTYYY
ncbi:MAG: hypothetical protein AB7G48_10975 [Nitrospiraceae bacterium]